MNTKDNFSSQAAIYKKFRPVYPTELYEYILGFVKKKGICWDCATGNGQAAKELAKHFNQVWATDISQKQLDHAAAASNITYSLSPAEKTDFPDASLDLVTVAQAIHWFDHLAFGKEVKRILKPQGLLAYWGYGLLEIDGIQEIIDRFYGDIVGLYWDDERKHLDEKLRTIDTGLKEVDRTEDFKIKAHWNREQLMGYFSSWSSVQHYMKANNSNDPLNLIKEDLAKIWPDLTEVREVVFPVYLVIEGASSP